MKVPALHKYYTINIFFYLNFYHAIIQPLLYFYVIARLNHLIPNFVLFPKPILHSLMNLYDYSVLIYCIIIEIFLRKLKILEDTNYVSLTRKQKILLYILQVLSVIVCFLFYILTTYAILEYFHMLSLL